MSGKFQLHWGAFFITFAVMMCYVYISAPSPKAVVKFPTPFNAGKIVYEDAAKTCFVFDAIEVKECPKDSKKQPLVEKFLSAIRVA